MTIQQLLIRQSDHIQIIDVAQLIFLKAEGSYCRFYCKGGHQYLSSRNLGYFQKQMSHLPFDRPHHSYFVNLKMVVSLDLSNGGEVCLTEGTRLPLSRRKRKTFIHELQLTSLK